MKVAIIGAGFAGLSVAYYLARKGVEVSVFESDSKPGGLAVGFKQPSWKWTLEGHYHHLFTSDWSIRNLADEIGYKVIFVKAKTSSFIDGKIYRIDSPLSLLTFPKLFLVDKLRTGCTLFFLRLTSNWKPLERVSAKEFIQKFMGKTSWEVLWEPLFIGKFHEYADKIPASWFWARIKKRSTFLGYPEGGFGRFASVLDEKIRRLGGKIYYKTPVERVIKKNDRFYIKTFRSEYDFYRVVCTLSTPLFTRITHGLPQEYKEKLLDLKGIGAVNLVLSLKKQFLAEGTYWLNINSRHFPFLAVVEHTNFMDKKYYGKENLVYVGNYLPQKHRYFRKDAVELFREFYPFLKTINPRFDKDWVNNLYLFKAHFAQPLVGLNYSKNVPGFQTPISGLYLCNIQQVYPWDRGTNYAVENGRIVAELILKGS